MSIGLIATGCGPKDSASATPSSTAPAAERQSESAAVSGAAPSAEALVGCRVDFEQERQRLLACGERTIMDARFPDGFAHEEALMVALGQVLGAISELYGVLTIPRRLGPVETLGQAEMSSFVLEAEGEDAGKSAPVIIMTMPDHGESRTMWCFPATPFATDANADREWCEEALSAFASGANLVGASMMSTRDAEEPCPEHEPCPEGPDFAASVAGMQKIADKVCACGDDAPCQDEARKMMQAWNVGPGMSRDPGTPEQNVAMGEALEQLMGCNTPFGLELMAE